MHKIEPFDWNVVINGFWNRAILTPSGIAERLFGIPKGSGFEVFVPVNGLAAPKVKHEGLVVSAEDRELIIGTEHSTFEKLEKAMGVARKALSELPVTPVSAAGFNVRFVSKDYPDELSHINESSIDKSISDAGYEIIICELKRQIAFKEGPFKDGYLNCFVSHHADCTIKVVLNFHKNSKVVKELIDWLDVSEDVLIEGVSQIIEKLMGINLKELEIG